ncbi:MAG: hypothetical protein ACO3UY_08410 [Opitutales bacterium]
MKIIPTPQYRSVECEQPDLDARSIAQVSCTLIDDLLVHPLRSAGRLSEDDLATIAQLKGVLLLLGEKGGVLEDWIEGKPHAESTN